ncbi:homoserine kinase type II [Friedmanniella endophytica]|uniref:Homoserine kinase type II n=1 Tax=Microlunatus kandeliicorticis TaxID=1759536 RepID=A0A7W3P7G4_9ACTN|nr:phosphotransferase [Microlunatus kandeliicorticis]MBA8795960.1 homoserine kinase type II [Microlunatus kandeliicorticis]
MDPDRLMALLPALLARAWDTAPLALGPLPAGMNSVVARVDLPDGSWVAKWAPDATADALDHGSAIAERLARHGLLTGAPRRTTAGELSAAAADGRVALLAFVDGVELTGETAEEQRAMAEALARVHAAEHRVRDDARARPFLRGWWSEPAAEPAWLAPLLADLLDRYDALPPLGWGVVHADPAPEAFLRTRSGEVGIIDWSAGQDGPLVYDVASALMYLGGRERGAAFLDRYREIGPLPPGELDAHLDLFGLLRAGVQAEYFAGRLAADDRTGIDGPEGNLEGFADARAMLASFGLETRG